MMTYTVGIGHQPAGIIAGWELLQPIHYLWRPTPEDYFVCSGEEYGVGATLELAVLDLIDSLGEFRESLERWGQKRKLGEAAVLELEYLRTIIVRIE